MESIDTRLAGIPVDLEPVEPVNPPAAYIGGKRNLASRLVAQIATVPHKSYVEPFVGMGGVFFRRKSRPPSEVINDISGDVANLFRILQRHYVALMDELRWRITTRADFVRLLKADATTLTDLERAVRFLYLQRLAFGGKVQGRTFGVSKGLPARFDVTKLGPQLAEVHERLARVVIEQLPYADLIRRYDSPATLFYLDPPYIGSETDYGDQFAPEDIERLAEQLYDISGKFILSINDTPIAREVFGPFHLETVQTTYSISSEGSQRAGELIVSNYGQIP